MTREVRQYAVVQSLVVFFTTIVLAMSVLLLWRAWPVAWRSQHVIATCGCVSTPATITTSAHWLALGIFFLTIGLLGSLSFHLVRSFQRQQFFHNQIRRKSSKAINHFGTRQNIFVVQESLPQAYSLGWRRPQVYLTQGLLQRLTKSEVTSVIRHEQSHCQFRDPLMATIFEAVDHAWGSVMPWVRSWVRTATTLRELIADAAATNNYHHTTALATAVAKLVDPAPLALAAMSPNTSRVEKLLNHNWRPNWHVWRWSYVAGALGLVIALIVLGRTQDALAKPANVSDRQCHEIQIMCRQATFLQSQNALCANDLGSCLGLPTTWSSTEILRFTPANE